ncbi:CRISPR-associated endonuclease Cas1 [Thermus sp.]|uniref:CRISPR-associated endonuclease Cas1 n=1 Tax=Thermus sp. TaxID=275 RepID=UPI00307D15AE
MHLYLAHQGGTLRLKRGRLILEGEAGPIASFPARQVQGVALFGNVRLSTPALTFLLRQGATLHFFSLEGALHGSAGAHPDPAPEVLRAQLQTPPLPLARAFLQGKLLSMESLLLRYDLPGKGILEALKELETIPDLERLRGLEGLASRLYFFALETLLGPYGMKGRTRRPPKDPVNAALSYGYALLLSRVLVAVRVAGLHPELGFLHAVARRQPALALDLMEEFRVPVVDQMVLSAFRRGQLSPGHAEAREGGIYLNEEGRRRLIALFENRLATEATHPLGFRKPYAELIQVQADRLKGALLERGTYTPFYLRK